MKNEKNVKMNRLQKNYVVTIAPPAPVTSRARSGSKEKKPNRATSEEKSRPKPIGRKGRETEKEKVGREKVGREKAGREKAGRERVERERGERERME